MYITSEAFKWAHLLKNPMLKPWFDGALRFGHFTSEEDEDFKPGILWAARSHRFYLFLF